MLLIASKECKAFFKCTYLAFVDFMDHDGVEHAGYLSFIMILSIFPFFVFFAALASAVFGVLDQQHNLSKAMLDMMVAHVQNDAIAGLIPRISEILSGPPQSLLTLAVIGTMWTSSSALESIRTILNRALRVSAPPHYILRRLLSIAQFLIITLVIVLSVVCIVLMPIIFEALNRHWGYIRYAISALTLFVCIAWLYFMIPNKKQCFFTVLPGAMVVSILWIISSLAFSWYLQNFHSLNTIYGSLAGTVAPMLFFYIISIFFIYGAELNYRLTEQFWNKDRR